MKYNFLLLAALLLNLTSYAQWVLQGLGYSNSQMLTSQIKVISEDTVWTAAVDLGSGPYQPTYSKTENGGDTWTAGVIPNLQGCSVVKMSAVSSRDAWFVVQRVNPDYAGMWRTYDGGQTWTDVTPIANSKSAFYLHFWNHTDGLVFTNHFGSKFQLFTTTDGGDTWIENPDPPFSSWSYIIDQGSVIGDTVFVMTVDGNLLKSPDKGLHWTLTHTPAYLMVQDTKVSFRDSQHGLLISAPGHGFMETFDGGTTWAPVQTTGPLFQNNIDWVPGTFNTCVNAYYSTVPACSLCFSYDGGHNWLDFDTLITTRIFDTKWANSHCGWATGISAAPNPSASGIWKFTGNLNDILKIDPRVGGVHVYPNPGRGEVNVLTVGFEGKDIRLTIEDSKGSTVFEKQYHQNLIQEQIKLDLTFLPDGCYFAKVNFNNRLFASKILIIR